MNKEQNQIKHAENIFSVIKISRKIRKKLYVWNITLKKLQRRENRQ